MSTEDVYVPGTWQCAKCKFVLVQSNLNADDGTVAARDEPSDKCPNCDTPLWHMTWKQHAKDLERALERMMAPAVPMILTCPSCSGRHIDEGEFASKPHHTHACQNCGMVWRPAIVPTVGVQFLPGFKDEDHDAPTTSQRRLANDG